MQHKTGGRDAAVSDIVGTVLLIGVTVALVGAAALQLTQAGTPEMAIRLAMTATGNSTAITLLHAGGSSLDEGQLNVLVTVNGTRALQTAAGPVGARWSVGNALVIPLSEPLPPGQAEVTLVHVDRSEVLATAAIYFRSNAAALTPAGFTLEATLNGGVNSTITAPGQVLATVAVTHPDGRKMVRYVFANTTGVDGPSWAALRDDGTHGDAAAADSTWSALLAVPFSSIRGDRTLGFTAVDLAGASASTTAMVNVV
ncbi:MAG: type IV pilin N-terminal domain-containing protein [Candidatus Thermoplasmatota archaeon]